MILLIMTEIGSCFAGRGDMVSACRVAGVPAVSRGEDDRLGEIRRAKMGLGLKCHVNVSDHLVSSVVLRLLW